MLKVFSYKIEFYFILLKALYCICLLFWVVFFLFFFYFACIWMKFINSQVINVSLTPKNHTLSIHNSFKKIQEDSIWMNESMYKNQNSMSLIYIKCNSWDNSTKSITTVCGITFDLLWWCLKKKTCSKYLKTVLCN